MSTATATTAPVANVPATIPFDQMTVAYTPLGETEELEISVKAVKNILAVRSRSNREPTSADIWKFMQLCKSRHLNPFVGDAYLLGYDNNDGTTSWSLITAIQALRKRAEGNPNYRGCQCGVIVERSGEVIEREGTLTLEGDKLLGGWSKVLRKDRDVPTYAAVKLAVYDTQRSRWKKDPGGMITKVAEAAALRAAFPTDLAELYIRDEFDRESEPQPQLPRATGIAGLKNRLGVDVPAAPPVAESAPAEPERREEPEHAEQPQPTDAGPGYSNPASMTPEELEELERDEAERRAGKLFDTYPQHD